MTDKNLGELISYIKEQLAQGLSREGMQRVLLDAGWTQEQVAEAWRQILSGVTEGSPVAKLQEEVSALRAELQELKHVVANASHAQAPQPVQTTNPFMAPASQPKPTPESAEIKTERETVVTGKLFAAIGIIALLFGVSFLLKYAFDHELIGFGARIIMGLCAGILMLVGGDLLSQSKTYKQYSYFISGGGLALLYLSLYFGFASYELFGRSTALLGMVMTTAIGIFLSLRSDEQPLVVMSVIGGFLTPLMVYGGLDDYGAMSLYGLVLLAATAGIGYHKGWHVPVFLAVAGSFFVQWVWLTQYYNELAFSTVALFLTLAYLIAGGTWFARVLAGKSDARRWGGAGLIGFMMYAVTMSLLMQDAYRPSLGAFLFFWAVVHGAAAYIGWRSNVSDTQSSNAWAVLATLLVTIAIPVQFDGAVVTALWLVMALLLAWVATVRGRHIEVVAKGMTILSVVALLFHNFGSLGPQYGEPFTAFANQRMALFVFAFAVLLLIAHLYKTQGRDKEPDAKWSAFVGIVANLAFVMVLSSDVSQWLKEVGTLASLGLSLLWLVYSGALMLIGVWMRLPSARKLALAGFGVTIIKVFLYDASSLSEVNRIISFMALGVILLLVSFFWYRHRDSIKHFLS